MAKRPTTTAYGGKKVAEGKSNVRLGAGQAVLGLAATVASGAMAATGQPILGTILGLNALSVLNSGVNRMSKGGHAVARGRATEALINRGKTGNTLGIPGARKMAAGVPPQIGPTSIDAAFNAANGKFTGARDAQSGTDGGSAGKKGWANPKTQAAAQRAKGNNYNGPSE
jgi:hypothetical protein